MSAQENSAFDAEFDYVLVGSGSAGSVLANRLTEDGRHRVCVLEAGPRDLNPFIHIPAGFIKTVVNPSVNWLYAMEPSEGTAGRSIAQPRGKTLGGSSSINGHIYNRGTPLDFDQWAQMGNRGWGYADVLPYFRRCERRIGDGDDTYRGREGNFVVEDLEWRHPLCEAFIDGAVSLGIPRNPDYNGREQKGVGYFQRSVHKGRRMSAARAFLHPARQRRNLSVITHAHATGIVLEGKRAIGVSYRRGASQQRIRAAREVIVCGGAINSPQLLQLSGIGPAPLLKSHGIEVKHALPGVGENLRDHYAIRLACRIKNTRTINELSRGLPLLGEIARYLVKREGILTLQPTLVHVFWPSQDHYDTSDLQLTFTPASYDEGVQSKLESEPGATVAAWQQRPESTGFVRIRSTDPFEKPIIQPNYLADEIDQQVCVAGIKLARRLMHTDPLAPFLERETFPGPEVRSDAELLDFARGRGTTAFHVMGTNKMGPATDPMAVVDDTLKVHGIEGLRVVDASVMPTMPSANTNASTLMIGEKAADLILGKQPLPAAQLDSH
ncbi:MAG: GMC family oxidoreductase N-terminal domain-containing protein [Gammaproteobacteria bacterium]|nr:GMC family oxidoreductase N-terminal domain-containing protein [Gammaproteobacteria bacterium]